MRGWGNGGELLRAVNGHWSLVMSLEEQSLGKDRSEEEKMPCGQFLIVNCQLLIVNC
jgi:hypothetical protein